MDKAIKWVTIFSLGMIALAIILVTTFIYKLNHPLVEGVTCTNNKLYFNNQLTYNKEGIVIECGENP